MYEGRKKDLKSFLFCLPISGSKDVREDVHLGTLVHLCVSYLFSEVLRS